MRYKSQPFLGPASRCSAPLYRRASGLCLCGTLLCRHCSAQFSTIQCYARAKLFFADADPFKAFTPLCQSMPLQVRSVLSRTIPLPCLATLCPCPTVLIPTVPPLCVAFRRHCPSLHCHRKSMHFLSSSPQCIAVPVQLNALPMRHPAPRFHALPLRRQSHRCHASASPLLAYAYHDHAMPGLFFAVPCPCDSSPCLAFAMRLASYHFLSITFPCRGSTHTRFRLLP